MAKKQISSATIFDALGFGRGMLPPRPVELPPVDLMAKVDKEYRFCQTCSRSNKPVVIVGTEIGKTTILCQPCVEQLARLFE